LTPSNGMAAKSAWFIVCTLIVLNRNTWPSGAARATVAVPVLPEAPERFSTTIGWPSASRR
jgi:hypothetical protein